MQPFIEHKINLNLILARSPVFTHLAATLGGLSTIRAFGAQKILVEEFDGHQDIHSAAWYMFITTSSAFGLTLDIMALIFVAVITFTFLVAGEGMNVTKHFVAIY